MIWSIRARLTAWYSLVVIAVLTTGVIAVSVVQERLSYERLDGELQRLMLTLEGVMRTEFNEGLTLESAAEEASSEVVAPDRTLALARPDGSLLQRWGRELAFEWRPSPNEGLVTVPAGSSQIRVLTRHVTYGSHRYIAAVMVPLDELQSQHAQLLSALASGAIAALVVAALGGWLIARKTLQPLADMARQAAAVSERDPTARLAVPDRHDELGRFAAAFNGLLDRLARALHAQRQFMADASHELRTPVSVVQTTAQVTLARTDRTEGDYRESLAIVAEQSARLARLVDAMFLLSRAEASGLPLVREHLYVDDVIEECVRAQRVLAAQRGVTVTANGTTDTTVYADNTLLRQMIGNLLDNAIRHARPNGFVSTTVTSTADQVAITVVDDGNGIPTDQRDHVFQRFVRLDRSSSGAGLGLPIARWIAEAHGGRLTLDPGEAGTSFRVVLPIT
jgi:signal transduction histidine kinase